MLLDGRELAGFIKQRHYEQLQNMHQVSRRPRLAIIDINQEVVSNKYAEIKQRYGEDIGVAVAVHNTSAAELMSTLTDLNQDATTHGVLVQLPLPQEVNAEEVTDALHPSKDVDALGGNSNFLPPTPNAIFWLLGGYGIEMANKTIGVIGQGNLVGRPLVKMLRESGQEPLVCDLHTGDRQQILSQADIIVTATGQPKSLTSNEVRAGVTVIDAGTASEQGALVGDVDPLLYQREDINISPVPGGVGPLTVCALFENVLTAFKTQELA